MDALVSDLLYTHNCVIIPEFGGIVANKKGVELLKFSDKINPPRKRLAFNRNLKTNDGLLVSHVALKLQCDYKEAERMVKSYVDDLMESMVNNKEAEIDNVGVFRKDYLGNIHFYPALDVNFELSAFGLSTLPLKPIARIKSSKEVLLQEAAKITVLNDTTSKKPILETSNIYNTSNATAPKEESEFSKNLMRVAAMFAGVFMVTSLIINLNQDIDQVDNSAIVPINNAEKVELIGQSIEDSKMLTFIDQMKSYENKIYSSKDKVEPISTEMADIDEMNNMIGQNVEELESSDINGIGSDEKDLIAQAANNDKDEFIHSTDSKGFVIVVGSFKTKQNAAGLLSDLKKKGYQSDTLKGPNGYTRVGVKFDAGQMNIGAALDEVRSNVEKDAWLLP